MAQPLGRGTPDADPQRLLPRRLVIVADRTTGRTVLEKAFGPDLALVRLVEMRSSRDHEFVFQALLTAAA